ncbi:MAG: tyrosine--tRNA ligase [Actinomycetota bacterium]
MTVDASVFLRRNAADVIPLDEFESKLAKGRPLRVKLGLDPTAEHVTLGWAVVLRKLREFQDLGHTAVLIVGDFTAQIGDPSGKDETRPMLSKDEVDAYAKRVLDQFGLILSKDNLEIRRNSEWLDDLGTAGLMKIATNYTVARMLERNDFADRYEKGESITMREFMYPLLQGYDSVAVDADVELGGTDQHFNLMVARHLQRAMGQEEQVVFEMPLLEGTDGVQKMSQSLGNYIGVTEEPDEMYGKLMRFPDGSVEKFLRLSTPLGDEEIAMILDRPPQIAKRGLAHEVVTLYHGRDAAIAAAERFDKVFVEHEVPGDIPSFEINGDGDVFLPQLLQDIGFTTSNGEGRRLIDQGGIHLGGDVVRAENVSASQLRGRVLKVGKRRFVRLV